MAKLVRIPSHPPNICPKLPHNINKTSQSDSVPKHQKTKFTKLLIRQEQQHQFTNPQHLNSPNFQITINNPTSNASNSNSHTPATSENKSNDPSAHPIIPPQSFIANPHQFRIPTSGNVETVAGRQTCTSLKSAPWAGGRGGEDERHRRTTSAAAATAGSDPEIAARDSGGCGGSWARRRERGEGGQICLR